MPEIEPMTYAIIETVSGRRRSEESARAFVNISFPVHGNERLVGLLMANIKNAIQVGFGDVQLQLEEDDEEDGEAEAEKKPSLFNLGPCAHDRLLPDEDPPKCAVCGAVCSCHVDVVTCPLHTLSEGAKKLIDTMGPAIEKAIGSIPGVTATVIATVTDGSQPTGEPEPDPVAPGRHRR